mmetsp:Transcript_4424/g.6786  ORF Transcript_4424/g.6786 Transcript_4424/m.6786 type:complete len:818 (+) Transcript_4424:176-2629(+)
MTEIKSILLHALQNLNAIDLYDGFNDYLAEEYIVTTDDLQAALKDDANIWNFPHCLKVELLKLLEYREDTIEKKLQQLRDYETAPVSLFPLRKKSENSVPIQSYHTGRENSRIEPNTQNQYMGYVSSTPHSMLNSNTTKRSIYDGISQASVSPVDFETKSFDLSAKGPHSLENKSNYNKSLFDQYRSHSYQNKDIYSADHLLSPSHSIGSCDSLPTGLHTPHFVKCLSKDDKPPRKGKVDSLCAKGLRDMGNSVSSSNEGSFSNPPLTQQSEYRFRSGSVPDVPKQPHTAVYGYPSQDVTVGQRYNVSQAVNYSLPTQRSSFNGNRDIRKEQGYSNDVSRSHTERKPDMSQNHTQQNPDVSHSHTQQNHELDRDRIISENKDSSAGIHRVYLSTNSEELENAEYFEIRECDDRCDERFDQGNGDVLVSDFIDLSEWNSDDGTNSNEPYDTVVDLPTLSEVPDGPMKTVDNDAVQNGCMDSGERMNQGSDEILDASGNYGRPSVPDVSDGGGQVSLPAFISSNTSSSHREPNAVVDTEKTSRRAVLRTDLGSFMNAFDDASSNSNGYPEAGIYECQTGDMYDAFGGVTAKENVGQKNDSRLQRADSQLSDLSDHEMQDRVRQSWVVYTTEDGYPYHYNELLGDSSWLCPLGLYPPGAEPQSEDDYRDCECIIKLREQYDRNREDSNVRTRSDSGGTVEWNNMVSSGANGRNHETDEQLSDQNYPYNFRSMDSRYGIDNNSETGDGHECEVRGVTTNSDGPGNSSEPLADDNQRENEVDIKAEGRNAKARGKRDRHGSRNGRRPSWSKLKSILTVGKFK